MLPLLPLRLIWFSIFHLLKTRILPVDEIQPGLNPLRLRNGAVVPEKRGKF